MLWIKEVEMVDSLEEVLAISFSEYFFQISRCWTRRLPMLWTRSSRSPSSRRTSVSRNRKLRKRTVSFEEDRSLSWSTTTFEWLALNTVIGFCWFILCCSSWREYSGLCYEMRCSSTVDVKDSTRWNLGKSVLRICESGQLKTVLDLYDMEIHEKLSVRHHQKLKTMAKRIIDQKHRLRNFDARHGRLETGAVVKNRKGLIGVEGGKGICYEWKEKGQCSQGDRCSFRHETQDRAQKPEHTAATHSEPTVSRGRSVSRKRSIRGKGNHGSLLRQPCRLLERYLHANVLWILASARVPILSKWNGL